MPSVANLKRGQRGIIKGFSVEDIPVKLLGMGCLPGNEVILLQKAPFDDPLYLSINGCHLSIRKETASKIEIELIDDQTY